MSRLTQRTKIISILIALALVGGFFATHSHAADLTDLSDTLSRLNVGGDANHLITFTTPSGVSAGGDMTITFASDFSTTSVDYTDIDVAVGGSDLDIAATPNLTTWGVAFGGTGNRTLTITSGTGTIAGSSVITIEIGTNATFDVAGDQAINNPSADSIYGIDIAGTFGDIGAISVAILSDDQIQVIGDIYPTLDFSVSSNTVGFGTMANTNVKYATANGVGSYSEPGNDLPVKLTAGTNAQHGLAISIQDRGDNVNAGLYASLAPELIPAAPSTEVINDSKKYGAYGKHASMLTLSEGFDNDGNADTAISRTAQTFASSVSQINGSVDVALLVAIDATTKPGSYSDTITIICTGNY